MASRDDVTAPSPARDDVTATNPARDDVTATSPARDDVTATSPARDDVTATSPARDDVTATSLALSRFLDHLELSEADIRSRVSQYRHLEVLAGAVDYQPDFQPTIITGSTVDGIWWRGYMSDLDTMILIPYVTVYDPRSLVGEERSGFVFELADDGTHPGYTLLKLKKEDLDMEENMFSMTPGGVTSLCYELEDSDGRFLSSFKMKNCFMRNQQVHERPPWVVQVSYHYAIEWPDEEQVLEHGPSVCFSDNSKDETPNDAVPTFALPTWPSQAAEWPRRARNWPSETKVKSIVAGGCNVVAVGFVGSKNRHMEWRLSFALIERDLIASFNNTQHKCYALLKMILKEVLLDGKAEGLTSFHMKNILLWTIEQTDQGIWKPEKIIDAIESCIKRLYDCLKQGSCPSYFIPKNNVFEGKVEGPDREHFLELLEPYARGTEVWKILLECPSLKNNYRFDKMLSEIEKSNDPHMELPDLHLTNKAGLWFEHDMRLFPRYEFARVEILTRADAGSDVGLAVARHYALIDDLERRKPNTGFGDAIDPLLRAVKSSLGSHLQSLFHNQANDQQQLLDKALQYLEEGVMSDAVAGKLKLANFHFMNGDVSKCLALAEDVVANDHLLSFYVPQLLPAIEGPSDNQVQRFRSFVEASPDKTMEQRYLECAAHAVIFFPSEIHSAPDAVKHQLRKVLPEPLDFTHWLSWAAYDPLVFAYFLIYSCKLKQNKPEEAEAALVRIESLHTGGEVAYEVPCLNLLGFSYLALKKPERAVPFFLRAIEKDVVPSGTVQQLGASLSEMLAPVLAKMMKGKGQ